MPSEKSATKNRTILDARRDPKLDAANSKPKLKPKSGESPIPTNRRLSPLPVSLSTRMTELAVARLGTIVRLGEALPVVFFSSAVDFILPVNQLPAVPDAARTAVVDRRPAACRPACRGSASGEFILPAVPDAARTAVVDRRQLTGKMKSTELGKNTFGTALPRRTIVRLTAFSRCVILGRWKMLSTPYPL